MKKFAWAMLATMAVITSCQVEDLYNDETLCDNDKFYATICDEGSSKTVMDVHNNIRWSAGDQLVIFTKTSLGVKYQIQDSYVGKTFGYFSKVTSASGSDDFGAGMSIDHNVAYYPYLSGVGAEKRGTGYELDVVLQSEQIYAPKSFGNGSFPMAAVSSDIDLTFKNVCGGIKLQLKGTCKVASIMIEGNNGERLSGSAVVTVCADEAPSIAMAEDASTSVILNCGDGVQLNEDTATEFIISLPPVLFSQGFTLTLTDSKENAYTVETDKENEVLRSGLLVMPVLTLSEGYLSDVMKYRADAIDMGLSVKWASWNVGAVKIDDYGGLYGLGDPTGLLTSTSSVDYNYGLESICGTEYDLAHIKWGRDWRLPTREELDELVQKCTWQDHKINGVRGSLVTGPNGNQIFLPFSGNRQGTTIYERGSVGHYWSGDKYQFHSYGYYDFDVDEGAPHQFDGCSTWIGQSIRPVCVKDEDPQGFEYVDEYGVNHGQGIKIGETVWAPVNCGYHKDDYKYGKLYQWGRKYGQGYDGGLHNGNSEDVIGTYSDAIVPTLSDVEVSAVSGQHSSYSNVFYISHGENYFDWAYPHDDKLWNSGTEANPVRTEYDPCPAGWRVPTYAELDELRQNSSSWTTNDEGYYGYWFSGKSTYTSYVPQVFFPAAGYRDRDGEAIYRNLVCVYKTSMPSDFGAYCLCLNYSMIDIISLQRGYGHSVRCVQEGSGVIVQTIIDLSNGGTANSYIVSSAGSYKFTPTKGNSSESVGAIASAEVLWETFGTDVTPSVGDLVKNVKYENGVISFQTPSVYREGNAVIAAKDVSGNILWSWHIWLTDQPEDQVYFNNAGTMMDRNLGATSATPGDVGALGLLYQWGRKDPFLNSLSIHYDSMTEANSTITWPSTVSSNSSTGTMAYATANPTTFIKSNSRNYDWCYTGSSSTDNTRWTTSETSKSIYDPCPAGWRVPDGGSNGVWSKALGSSSYFSQSSLYDITNEGMNFSGKFGSASTIWYPASRYRYGYDGGLDSIGDCGNYWSASPSSNGAYYLSFTYDGNVSPLYDGSGCASGRSLRCIKEGTGSGSSASNVVDLSTDGKTANSYVVSKAGSYKFTPTKGNSSESVGAIASAEVLWESFGTDVTPSVGDLVKNVKYENGAISFQTPSVYREGNAVIAAKDVNGTILWSWHIWLTDQPEGQEYYNNAGTMMDRNLGATSAIPGDVGALGLLYQWGRKDPFLGSSSISSSTVAESTITWPSAVSSNSNTGTIAYATANPTTFITRNICNYDWYYTGSSSIDNTRWTTSEMSKSIYDPCPAGWRVPDGGSNGVWSKACGSSSYFTGYPYDSTNEGMNFSGKFGSDQAIWYPASGYRSGSDGSLHDVGFVGLYWSASPNDYRAYYLYFHFFGNVNPSYDDNRAYGRFVRCFQESK